METKTPHPHGTLISEAVRDTSRKILGKLIQGFFWDEVTLSVVVSSNELWEFCFADTIKPIKSSLTEQELYAIADKYNPHKEDINYDIVRGVADAAAAKHDADIARKPPPLKGSPYAPKNFIDHDMITPDEIQALYKNTGFKLLPF